jgi:intracellular septation protein
MQSLIQLLPLLLFFAAYKFFGIFWATGIGIVAYGIQILYMRYKGTATKLEYITFWMFFFFGGLTIIFQSEAFLQWKITILSVGMGLAIYVSFYGYKKNLLQLLFDTILASANKKAKNEKEKVLIVATEKEYKLLNHLWAVSFLLKGVANYYIATYYSLDNWVNYKTFAIPIFTLLTIGFTVGVFMHAHQKHHRNKKADNAQQNSDNKATDK